VTEEEIQKELERRNSIRRLESLDANESRAQSFTVGTAGGGTVEIIMRSASGKFLWNVYQPVEIVEIINQLSSGIGCEISLVPKQDFSTWRTWKEVEEFKVNKKTAGEENVAAKKIVNKRSPKRTRSSSK
tara:strand:- start:299 stop:688 length:390 start_codon:yes stop_codon:yes gene_type:complete